MSIIPVKGIAKLEKKIGTDRKTIFSLEKLVELNLPIIIRNTEIHYILNKNLYSSFIASTPISTKPPIIN